MSITRAEGESPYYFYDHENKKIFLSLNTEYIFLSAKEPEFPANVSEYGVKAMKFRPDLSSKKKADATVQCRFYTELRLENVTSDKEYLKMLSEIQHRNKDVIVAPYFNDQYGSKIGLSNFYYVKLKKEEDVVLLKKTAAQMGCVIVSQDEFMPLWFKLSVTETSELNALENANYFHESGLFSSAKPDLMADIAFFSDTYFGQQYYLKNTGLTGGTSGIDIKAESAWQIATGSNVIVAVIDHGVDLEHDDLKANKHSVSYDAVTGMEPQIIRGPHGTAVAGIIGAVKDNGKVIAGVAPNSKIMAISHTLTAGPNARQELAAGINWAWQNGAHVINGSWGHQTALSGTYITDAINLAVSQGRKVNGVAKGCVVVFASGNNMPGKMVAYPGAAVPETLVVGSITRTGALSSFSSYGYSLDVVAPGNDIRTTYHTGGYITNSGTSFAAPQVSAIAALILSQYPNLEQWKVRLAIEKSCRKLPGYHFFTNLSVYPSGSWNSDIGYGLVDAAAALAAAQFGPFVTGVDFTFTNNSSFEIDGLYVGLTGKLGNVNTTFINCEPNYVAPGSSTGLPAYPGLDILAAPGTPITDLSLQLWAYTYNSSHPEDVRISARVEGAWQDNYSYLDLDGVSSLTMPLTYSNPSVPSTGRLMLHINVTDYYYGWKSPLNGNVAPDSLKMVK